VADAKKKADAKVVRRINLLRFVIKNSTSLRCL
jgi:hypothetical protein